MRIIKLKDTLKVHCPRGGFTSRRYLLEKDNMGYTITNTIVHRGEWQFWHYKQHLESCLCIKGHGEIRKSFSTKVYDIRPGTMYVLDKHDQHQFRAIQDTILICVFNPPLKGQEVHQEDGSYSTKGK